MKRLDQRDSDKRTRKQLTLHRETLRQLDAGEMQRAAGGLVEGSHSCWFTCGETFQ